MVGLPGAGKTAVRRGWHTRGHILTMRDLLARERVRAGRKHRRAGLRIMPPSVLARVARGSTPSAGDAAHFAVAHPQLHDLVWSRSRAALDEARCVTALELMWDAWGERGFGERVGEPEDVLLQDEGIWQRLAYLLAVSGVRTPDAVPSLPRPLPPLAGLVMMDVPLAVARSRVARRARGFSEVDLLPAMEMILAHIVEDLRAAGTPCLVVDGQQPIKTSRDEVRGFLAATTTS